MWEVGLPCFNLKIRNELFGRSQWAHPMIQISAQTASPGSILIFPYSWCVRGSGGVLSGPAGATEKKFEDKSPSRFLILSLILGESRICISGPQNMYQNMYLNMYVGNPPPGGLIPCRCHVTVIVVQHDGRLDVVVQNCGHLREGKVGFRRSRNLRIHCLKLFRLLLPWTGRSQAAPGHGMPP